MSRTFRHLLASLCGRRSLSAALLATYITTAAGVPLPVGTRPHSDELYPCANCACGCGSAEQCWRSCCCHSLSERFAWAREHGVRPPDFAIAEAQRTGVDLAWLGIVVKPTKSSALAYSAHAAKGQLPACCQAHAKCCDSGDHACCSHERDKNDKSKTTDHVIGWRVLNCGGQSLNWLAAVPTLIVVRPIVSDETVMVTWLGPNRSESVGQSSSLPDVPPPERA